MNSLDSCRMVSVFDALQKAHEENNLPPTQPPLTTSQWANLIDTDTLVWENTLFGKIQVRLKNERFSLGDIGSEGEATWASMFFSGQPNVIEVEVKATQKEGVRVLRSHGPRGSTTIDVTDKEIDPLKVEIEWRRPAGAWIEGRTVMQPFIEPHQDLNIIFINSDGMFAQIEIGTANRSGNFSVTLQEMYCGQVVRTTREKAEQIDIVSVQSGSLHAALAVPLYAENAYPGADYVKTFGEAVIKHAISRNAIVPMSKAVMAEWQQPHAELTEEMKKKGWQLATVTFFNLSWYGGSGFALLEDGRFCYLNWRQIEGIFGESKTLSGNRRQFPILSRMTRIAVKAQGAEKGLKAVAIRKI